MAYIEGAWRVDGADGRNVSLRKTEKSDDSLMVYGNAGMTRIPSGSRDGIQSMMIWYTLCAKYIVPLPVRPSP